MHRRLRPRRHELRYRVFSLLLDLDELPRARPAAAALVAQPRSICSASMTATTARGAASRCAPQIEGHARAAGIELARRRDPAALLPARARLRLQPAQRLFLPPTATARLRAILYEVSNTFGEQHWLSHPGDAARTAWCGKAAPRNSMSRRSWRWRDAMSSASPRRASGSRSISGSATAAARSCMRASRASERR